MKSTRRACARALIAAAMCVVPVSAYALDLPTVLEQVATANPSLEAQRGRAAAAERGVAPAGAWPSPRVELGLVNVPTSGFLDQEPMTQKRIGLSQKIPIFGRAGLSRESAQEAARAEVAATENTHWMLLGQAWSLYAVAYSAAQRAHIAESHQGVMARMVESARARYESGSGRLEDLLRARSGLARLRVDIEVFRSEARRARVRLDGLRGAAATTAAGGQVDVPPATRISPADSAWANAVAQQHPRLRELEAREAGHRFASEASHRQVWPDVELKFAYGFREDLFPTGKKQDDLWTALVAFDLPIFAGGNEIAEGERQEALADVAAADRHAAELELESETLAAVAEARAAQRTVALLADTVVVTQQRALDASWSAYSAGTSDLWRTLEAAHALYDEQIALTHARETLGRAEGRLIALTGRGDLLGVDLPAARVERRQP